MHATSGFAFWVKRLCGLALLFFAGALLLAAPASPGELQPFWPDGKYDPKISTPDSLLGFAIGERPLHHDEMIACLRLIDQQSPRVLLREHGRSYEGRSLCHLIVSAPENIARLEEIQLRIAQLADPRKLGAAAAREIAAATPAIVWMAYSIHGNEASSTDAAVQLAWQLAAGQDDSTLALLKNLIIIIDPLQNPDGRERALNSWDQWRGPTPNSDVQSMHHSGQWPGGRGNHYLFDLNRDFLPITQVETLARIRAVNEWRPQLFVDSHEMGGMDTYLFSPPREPIHPLINSQIRKWWQIFARDQARTFDRHGWRYYTGDWSESWYPGYADAWVLFGGAVGILYEQARVEGSQIKQLDGYLLTFRETVLHQFSSSMANLLTAARHKQELLEDYYQSRRQPLLAYKQRPLKVLALDPALHPEHTRALCDRLQVLGIELQEAQAPFTADPALDYWGVSQKRAFAKGTILINLAQPLGDLVLALCEFDPRMQTSYLQEERKELEKHGGSRIYDVTAWSLPMAYGVEAFWLKQMPGVTVAPIAPAPAAPASGIAGWPPAPALAVAPFAVPAAPFAWLINYRQDAAPQAALALLQAGYTVHAAEKAFKLEGQEYAPGTLVLFAGKNSLELPAELERIAAKHRVEIRGVSTGLAQRGLDLGSSRYALLKAPRIGLFANTPVSSSAMGTIWYLLDQDLQLRFSLLDLQRLGGLQLELYNILILPPVWSDAAKVREQLGKAGLDKLKRWMESGGTLIALGSGAALAADSSLKWSQVRPRAQVLDQLAAFAAHARRMSSAGQIRLDSLALWSTAPAKTDSALAPGKASKAGSPELKALQERDRWLARFLPSGVILRADLDEEHWLAFGLGSRVPVYSGGAAPLLAKEPVQIAAHFAATNELRLSGLLWPEARELLAESAYATRESIGDGQLILIADEPYFRACFKANAQLLLNAIILGPGMGTAAQLLW